MSGCFVLGGDVHFGLIKLINKDGNIHKQTIIMGLSAQLSMSPHLPAAPQSQVYP